MRVDRITGFDLRLGGEAWPFARENASAIATHWRELMAQKPGLWNGEVLICTAAEVRDAQLTARFAFTDYASFVAWRNWGAPDKTVRNCFGVPVVATRDRALVFAEMADHTLNAGFIYPPSGSLERRDVRADGTIDIEGSMRHELMEETGLNADEARKGNILVIHDAHRLAVARAHLFSETFNDLQQRFAAHCPEPQHAELTRLIAVRGPQDISPAMPAYAQEIVRRYSMD